MTKRKLFAYVQENVTKSKRRKISKISYLPNELIHEIFYHLSFRDKQQFKFLSRGCYNFYWNYVRKKRYLSPIEHIFMLRSDPPLFFEFRSVSDGECHNVSFTNGKQRRLKFKGNEMFCRIPMDEYSNVYVIDKKYMNVIGKSVCNRCLNFDHCTGQSMMYCSLKNCLINGPHHHSLCRDCKNYDYYLRLQDSLA